MCASDQNITCCGLEFGIVLFTMKWIWHDPERLNWRIWRLRLVRSVCFNVELREHEDVNLQELMENLGISINNRWCRDEDVGRVAGALPLFVYVLQKPFHVVLHPLGRTHVEHQMVITTLTCFLNCLKPKQIHMHASCNTFLWHNICSPMKHAVYIDGVMKPKQIYTYIVKKRIK